MSQVEDPVGPGRVGDPGNQSIAELVKQVSEECEPTQHGCRPKGPDANPGSLGLLGHLRLGQFEFAAQQPAGLTS